MRHIAVTGATGFVARHVRRHLSGDMIQLHSISRNDFDTMQNEKKIIIPDYDSETILSGIQSCDSMIHLVGIGSQSIHNDFDRINHGLTGRMLETCKKAGVRKFVYLSGLGVSGNSQLDYFLSKYMAETEIKESGLDYTIFRPSYIVGDGDLLSLSLKRQIRLGRILIPGSGRFRIQPITIHDACSLISKSVTDGELSNRTLDMVGPELLAYEDFVGRFPKPPNTKIKRIPLETAYHDAINGRGDFGIDDLNLLVGGFCGNFEELGRVAKMEFHKVLT